QEPDPWGQRVRFDVAAVVRTDLDVDAHHDAVAADKLQQRGVENQPTAVRHAHLDDHLGAHLPNDFLQRHQVLRPLDDGDAEPGEVVFVLVTAGLAHYGQGRVAQVEIGAERGDVLPLLR